MNSSTRLRQLTPGTGRPIRLVLDNARYQKCRSVTNKAAELGIELFYLSPYSPNLNLIKKAAALR